MGADLFSEVIEQAYASAEEINFSYFGEPMMHPKFLEFMDMLKDRPKGFRIVMNSNISYATGEIFEKLIEIDLDELRVSLDAATPQTYEIVRPGNFFVTWDGDSKKGDRFSIICEKLKRWHEDERHRPTRHVFTVGSKNIHEIEQYSKIWKPCLDDDDVILFKNILTYGGKMGDDLIKAGACNNWELNSLTVDWSGRVSACHLDTNMELQVGHMKNNTLGHIYVSDQRAKVKALSQQRKITPCDTCVDSNYWDNTVRVYRDSDHNGNIAAYFE